MTTNDEPNAAPGDEPMEIEHDLAPTITAGAHRSIIELGTQPEEMDASGIAAGASDNAHPEPSLEYPSADSTGPDAAGTQTCPACGATGGPDAAWCEACGADYAGEHAALTGPPCIDCGAPHEEIIDGYCSECGRKQPAERDHQTETATGTTGLVVAASDRGLRHHQNEDAYAIAVVGDRLVAVVCDGVSTTADPQDASMASAVATRDSLVAALEAGETDIEAELVKAVASAQAAAAAVATSAGGEGAPSTTIVASVLVPDTSNPALVHTYTACLGDSRAYWMHDADGKRAVTQLTTDDEFEGSITKWLGADAGNTTPNITLADHDAGGSLLLCSDGLWKYAASEDEMAAVLAERVGLEGLELASALVAFAIERGGHDNTTVVIAGPHPSR